MLKSNLSDRLDLWGFERGAMIFRDESVGSALAISPVDVAAATDSRVNEIKSGLRHFLNGLPAGLTFQFVQEVVRGNEARIVAHKETLRDEASPLTKSITEERVQKYRELDAEGLLPKRNLYAIFKMPFRSRLQQRSVFRFRKSKARLTEETINREIDSFEKAIAAAAANLRACGIESRPLSESETFQLAYDQWNPDRGVTCDMSVAHDVRDQVILTDCVIGLDHFVLGKIHHKVISLKLLPEMTFASMAEALSSLPFDSRLYLTVEVLDQEKEKSKLQTQRRLAYASTVGKKGVSDLESQAKLRDIEALLEEMIQGSERVFRFSLNVLLRSDNFGTLDSQTSDTLSLIRSLSGAEGMVETVAAFDIFTEFAIPQVKIKERAIKVNTSVLSDFLPVYGGWQGHEVPQMLLRNRMGELVGFDPFSNSLSNPGQIISGGSGSGKSFLCNLLISQMLKNAPKVFILDVGASYKRFCENVGGQYIAMGLSSGLSINPLSLAGIDLSDSENMDEKIKMVASLVEIMTKEHDRGLGRLEKSELEKCVQEILSCESEQYLSDLQALLLKHADPEIKRVGRVLSMWCGDSPFGRFVDRPTTIDLNADVVCFDLKGLESHRDLQAVSLFLIMDLVWREVQRDRTKMKLTVFDECWRLLESDEGAAIVGSVFRTFRKYRASAIAISQTMDDFSKSKIAPAIMPNSSIKWILKQKGADQKSLQESLQLNEREMELTASLRSVKGEYSESFLIAEDKRVVIRIEATPLEYWLSTTDPQDLLLMEQIQKKRKELNQFEVLKELAARYPQGAGKKETK